LLCAPTEQVGHTALRRASHPDAWFGKALSDGTVVNFSCLARLSGMPLEDIAAARRRVREAHAAMRNRRPSDSPH